MNPQAWELVLSITPGCLPLLRGETTDAVFFSLKYFLQILIGSPARIFSHVTSGPSHSLRSSSTTHPSRLQAFIHTSLKEALIGVLSSTGPFAFSRCMGTTLFSPPVAKFSRRCYSALADSHRQPHTCTSVQF